MSLNYDMQFAHKQLVQVKIGGIAVMLYPVIDDDMKTPESAYAFQVNKSNLQAVGNLTPRQILTAMGLQTRQSAVVDGAMASFLRHFHDHWRNFFNLTIMSWHDSSGTIINNTTLALDPAVLLPIVNGPLAACRQQDVRFVRVQVSVDYSYAIRGVSPLRLDFYIELPQSSTPMLNGAGNAYTLVTYAGVADLRTLNTEQAKADILDVTYQTGPGQIVPPAFGTISATLNQVQATNDCESKILRVVLDAVFNEVFAAIAPNYTNQPQAALEHVTQVYKDADGKEHRRSVQSFYTQFMQAIQPFIMDRDFSVNAAEKFKSNMDPDLKPHFRTAYPLYATVVELGSVQQLAALRNMLKAAQQAEDNQAVISNAAIRAVNHAQSFLGDAAGTFASQAERTISESKKIKCFGCGENHLWSVKQADRTFKVTCPNQKKQGIKDKANAEIDAMKKRRRDRRDESQRQRKKLKSTSETSTTTTNTSVATSPGNRVVFVVQACVTNAGGDLRLPMPIQIMNILPHVLMPLGATLETPNCPEINCAVDTCAGLNTGSYAYLMALAKKYPHCLYKLCTSREYKPIELRGIVGQNESAVTTSLDCTFQFLIPFQMRGTGADCALAIAAGDNVAVNVILGLPFIIAMKSNLNFVDMLMSLNAIDCKPFPMDLRKTSNAVPISDSEVNISEHADTSVYAQLQHYDQWRSSQVAAVTVSTMSGDTMSGDQAGVASSHTSIQKRVRISTNPSASSSTVPNSSIPDPMVSCIAETQNLAYHSVERCDSYM
jgi:hypothetical protein